MAHILRFTRDSQTITLTSSPFLLLEYVPVTPTLSTIDAVSELEDGGERIKTTRRNVREVIEVMLRPTGGQTMADVASQIETLENWLLLAEAHQEDEAGSPLYLEFQKDGENKFWRSEVLGGYVSLDRSALHTWLIGKRVEFEIAITRRYYFEQSTEDELPASTKTVTDQLGGVTLYNHTDSDAGHGNWLEIAGQNIGGVLPAPMRLEMRNTYDSSSRAYKFIIGQNVFAGMTYTHQLEGEDGSYFYGGSTQNLASCSGGKYRTVSVATAWGPIISWDVTSAMLAQYRGRFFRILARFPSAPPPSGTRIKARITFPAGSSFLTNVAESEEVQLDPWALLQEIGTIQIPPWLIGETNLTSVSLALYGKSSSAGNLSIDFIQLLPIDGWRVLMPKGYGLAYNCRLVDDGMNGSIWTDGWSPAGKTGHYVGRGQAPLLWPGRTCRVYVLQTGQSNAMEIDRTISAKIYYRPRRLTV